MKTSEREELKAKIKEMQAILDKQETTLKEGDMVIHWDGTCKPSIPYVGYFNRYDADENLYYVSDGEGDCATYFEHCELYQPKNKWIEHTGNKCPVDEDADVIIYLRSGNISWDGIKKAKYCSWKIDHSDGDIIRYMVVED